MFRFFLFYSGKQKRWPYVMKCVNFICIVFVCSRKNEKMFKEKTLLWEFTSDFSPFHVLRNLDVMQNKEYFFNKNTNNNEKYPARCICWFVSQLLKVTLKFISQTFDNGKRSYHMMFFFLFIGDIFCLRFWEMMHYFFFTIVIFLFFPMSMLNVSFFFLYSGKKHADRMSWNVLTLYVLFLFFLFDVFSPILNIFS